MFTNVHESLFKEILQKYTGNAEEEIRSNRPLSGGDINQAACLETHSGKWFAKWNRADAFPGMFEAEAKGLEYLLSTGEMHVPEIIGTGKKENISMLVLEFVTEGKQKSDFWMDFGSNLARMHRHSAETFGLDHDNYIGSLPQINDTHQSWKDFFMQCRLQEQARMARDGGKADASLTRKFDALYKYIDEFFPVEKPSLVHGDLWGGNYMTNNKGEACIIDPAVYFGHRLMDIGMSKLFGGFAPDFYEAYNNEWPLESNWKEAVDIANLYPLMVHVNLFGGGYMGSVKSILNRF